MCLPVHVNLIVVVFLSTPPSAYLQPLYPDYEDTAEAHGPGTSFSLHLPPGIKECFYQNIEPGQTLDVEFQVTKGGNLDIDYFVRNPRKKTMVMKSQITNSWDSHVGLHVTELGDYEICFSNEFSQVSSKQVFVSIGVASLMEEGAGMELHEEANEFIEISKALDKIEVALYRAEHIQMLLIAHEGRDVYLAESNNVMIPFWTIIESFVILLATMYQIYFVKQLFVNERNMHS